MESYTKIDICISAHTTLKDAMQKLDQTAEKLLLVVDKESRLLGCLSDGDIRRHILNGHSLSSEIKIAYNPHPIAVEQEYNKEHVKELMIDNKIRLIPIVDPRNQLLDYLTWEDIFGEKKDAFGHRINADVPVVIMAGGKGTRLDPFTRILPKPLIPIGNQPIIEIIIDKFKKFGIKDFYLTVNHMSKIIRAYFEEKTEHAKIQFVEEDQPLGTAGSLKLLKGRITSDFFVTNCDIIIDADYADIFDFHQKNHYELTLVASTKNYSIPYGICEIENGGRLLCIKEKPEYNFLANTGLYLIKDKVLDLIPHGTLFDMTDLIASATDKGMKVGVYPISEQAWLDVGEWAEYKKSIQKFDL